MLSKLITCLALAAVLLAPGCYDDGNKEECVGLKCPAGFQWPEGGEVRLWTIRTPDGAVIRRFFGFFIASENPDVPNTQPQIGRCARSVDADQGMNVEYYDVGDSITFELGDGEQVEVPKLVPDPTVTDCMPGRACAAGVVDFYGRVHQVAYLLETVTPGPLPESYYNNFHTVRTANQMALSDRLDHLFLGPSFTVTKPERPTGALTMKRGQDVVFEWQNDQTPNPDVVAGSAIVIVPDGIAPTEATGCISLNDGDFTVPAATVDALSADTGIMLVGNGADEAILTDDGRVFHKWGLFCNLIPWTRVD